MSKAMTREDEARREQRRTSTEYVLMLLAGFILGWAVQHLVGAYLNSWLAASLVIPISFALLVLLWLQLD